MPDLTLFSGSASEDLAEKVALELNVPLGNADVGRFSDGEVTVEMKLHVTDLRPLISTRT